MEPFIQHLIDEDDNRQANYRLYRDYYDGQQGVILTRRQREYLHVPVDKSIAANYMHIVVISLATRLTVTGFEAVGDKKLTKEFSDMQSRIGEGNSISTKWAATAELFSKYAVEANNTAAECELTKSRKARAEQAGLSARMLNQLSSRVKDCSAEVLRMVALTGHHSRVLASVEEAVERVSLEVKFLGEEADTNARDRLKYELEKKLNGEVDEAKRTLVKFDPRNKSIPTN